jgi:beta-phosphoglucomutase-like phosphatase (HAD superfamily)
LDRAALCQAFVEALCWTLVNMRGAQRRRDVTQNARACGLADLLHDAGFHRLTERGRVDADNVARLAAPFVERFGEAFRCEPLVVLVSAALDVYYFRYHAILQRIAQGRGADLSQELLGEPGRRLIEPMPGYDVFIPLVKGWLGPEIDGLYEMLRSHVLGHPELALTAAELDAYRPRLVRLAEHFQQRPAKVALVTASIAYETHAVLTEVVNVMRQQVRDWPVPAGCRDRLAEKLADHRSLYDALVNASDVCEHRLKPHRDLFSLALYRMSVPREDYCRCVGLEDTEPGIIALRAAGVGCAVALPNRDTRRQDYSAATKVVKGGLPALLLLHNLLLREP